MRKANAVFILLLLAGCATADCGGLNLLNASDGTGSVAADAPQSCAIKAPPSDLKSSGVDIPATTVTEYCTAENGFAAGASGETYAGVCVGPAAEAFLAEYARGEKLVELDREAIAASQAASDAMKDLWQVKRRIMEVDTRRISSVTSRAERTELNVELKSLQAEKDAIESEMANLAAAKSAAAERLASYRSEISSNIAAAGALDATKASY